MGPKERLAEQNQCNLVQSTEIWCNGRDDPGPGLSEQSFDDGDADAPRVNVKELGCVPGFGRIRAQP